MPDVPIHTASGTTVYHYDGDRLVGTEFLPAAVTVTTPPAVQYHADGRMVNPPPPLDVAALPVGVPTAKTLAEVEAEIRKLETTR